MCDESGQDITIGPTTPQLTSLVLCFQMHIFLPSSLIYLSITFPMHIVLLLPPSLIMTLIMTFLHKKNFLNIYTHPNHRWLTLERTTWLHAVQNTHCWWKMKDRMIIIPLPLLLLPIICNTFYSSTDSAGVQEF